MTDREADTYFSRAQAALDDRGGRFVRDKPLMSGVPQLPEASPWRCEPVGIEPPLGVDVNAVPDLVRVP
jgi:hypothetical protein